MSVDLRELMRERSNLEPATRDGDRVEQVRRRIVRVRRRRTAIAAGTALAVVLAVTMLVMVPLRRQAPPPPAVTPSPTRLIDGFPEYRGGARTVATRIATLPDHELALTFTPTTLDLTFSVRCSPRMFVETRVNGHKIFSTDCGAEPDLSHISSSLMSELGVTLSTPVTVTVTPTHVNDYAGEHSVERPLPAVGTYALAIGERMPFTQYPLPDRPATLAPMDFGYGDNPVLARLDSNPDDPLRTVNATVRWTNNLEGRIAAQTPGLLNVAVNGESLVTHESWDYTSQDTWFSFAGGGEVSFPEGELVTITVTPQYVTGPWALVIIDGPI